MSSEHTNVTFYSILNCGYYRRGEDAPIFGSLEETLGDLSEWSKGKSLQETKLGDLKQSDTAGNVYLLDIQQRSGTWLIKTWNEVASTDGKVASVQAESQVGDAKVVMNTLAAGSIPGYASYFWIIPSEQMFASIRFQHPYTAQQPFRAYIQKFMEQHGRYVVYGDSDEIDELNILGYRKDQADQPRHAFVRFTTMPLRNPGNREHILNNVEKISKVIKKETLNLAAKEDKSFWQSCLRKAVLSAPDMPPVEPRISYELPFKPTAEDVNNIFDGWEAEHDTKWDDVGFKIYGDVCWVSHTLARGEINLEVERESLETVSSESLLSALIKNKNKLMLLVRQ